MSVLVEHKGRFHRPLVTCHKDGKFTYHDGGKWVPNADSVPPHVMAALPVEEVARVNAHVHRRMGDRNPGRR